MKVEDQHPAPHAKYLVERGGILCTATPCYGMHEPWWVVRTLADSFGGEGEAEPVPMRPDDRWWPLKDACRMMNERDESIQVTQEVAPWE